MAGLTNLKLLTDFFNKIGQEATFDRCSADRLASGMWARFVRDLFDQITQNAQSAIQ